MSIPSTRLSQVATQLTHDAPASVFMPSSIEKLTSKSKDDIVITARVRTPLTKARKGLLKDTSAEDLLLAVLTAIREVSAIEPSAVDDVCVGNVLSPGFGYGARSAVLAAGFPVSTAASVVNRFCSSGLLAIQHIATSIMSGAIDVGIAAGVESMSTNPDEAPALSDKIMQHDVARDNVKPMGWTSENVAREFGISRETHDRYALASHMRAAKAQAQGWTADEIVPINVLTRDVKTGQMLSAKATSDDGVRPGTTIESLNRIRPAFPQWPPSNTTGGNASQITDGAAAILLMKRSMAERLGQSVLGKFVLSTVVGLPPNIMGIGPSLAIPKVLKRAGVTTADIDLFEINEAFSSMYAYCVEKLALDLEKVNPRGGAIAIGHPLGCTGVRQVVTLLSELKRQQKKVGVTSMCVGTGMGMAAIFVSEA